MLRKLFQKNRRVIEAISSSGQRRMMSLDEYRNKMIEENRERSRSAQFGHYVRQEPRHIVTHFLR